MKSKIFCISMQRTATSSVGDFFESNGYSRVGHQISDKLEWSRKWYNGDYEAIFSDEHFINAEILEDDPFWFPDFFKVIYHRFPNSKFVFLYRDSDAWFKSMISHSNGYSLGLTDIHAKIYNREKELFWLQKNIPDFNCKKRQSMVLFDKATDYKDCYEVFKDNVIDFFSTKDPKRFFISDLNTSSLWDELSSWASLPKGNASEPHAHKTKQTMRQENLLGK